MILLIGNYAPDRQQSMLRFAGLMRRALPEMGIDCELIAPESFCGNFRWPEQLRKWAAYVDKFLLFPTILRRKLTKLQAREGRILVHVCDHSNSMYVATARRLGFPMVITCHDMGAVRGALGEDTDCPASATGRWLQRWIRMSMSRADAIACVSAATRLDVERLVCAAATTPPLLQTILLGLNTPYKRISVEETQRRLAPTGAGNRPYLLNVGSSLSRKNRNGVLRIFGRITDQWPGVMVFAGAALSVENRRLVAKLGLQDRVLEIVGPSDDVLEALYNKAFALLFPSKFEGFGWPVIEAQACGCPVLCSDAGSLAEVAGEAAFVRPWTEEDEFAGEILRLVSQPDARDLWVERGYANLERFQVERMIRTYAELYEKVLGRMSDEPLAMVAGA